MAEVPLPIKYSGETYDKALSNIVNRWEKDGEGPIKYDDAAIGMGETTVSYSLKFLSKIGILDSPKAGFYNVPDEVVDYTNKVGEVEEQAKQQVEQRLQEYPVYEEAKFLLELEEFTLEELSNEIAGSSRVSANEDEVPDVERSLKILETLGFFTIDEEGTVTLPESTDDVDGDSEEEQQKESPEDNPTVESAENSSKTTEESKSNHDFGQSSQAQTSEPLITTSDSQLTVDLNLTMDITAMGAEELETKLEVIEKVVGHDG